MNRSSLFALLFTAPLTVMAQFAVFTDTFGNSTLNGMSVPGGTPTASFTSYDIASTKNASTAPTITNGNLRIGLNAATTSGLLEAQALFTGTPVTLKAVGDYINLTYTFTNTGGTLLAGGTSSSIVQGLFNSGGFTPVAGALTNAGLNANAGSIYAAGNCANWQGYVSRIIHAGTSQIFIRPPQNGSGTASANQDLLFNNVGGGAFNNPVGAVIGSTAVVVPIVAGSQYTASFTVALTDAGIITVSNNLYDGVGTGGTLIFSLARSTNDVSITSFDGLSIGVRNSGTSFNPTMDISRITVTKSIYGTPGPSFNVTGGGLGCPGDQFVVGLSGSVTTNSYLLYTNDVFSGLVQNGTGSAIVFPAQTVLADPLTITVVASNIVNGFTGLMSGSVLVAPLAGPVITTQPVPLMVAANSLGTFTVSATGGGLNYGWYRNGTKLTDGGHIAGSGTPTLVISPVTDADAAITAQGYYCLITNACGYSAITITNSLTLGTPAGLVWQGGNPDNNWDLLTTANFTKGAGGPQATFNAGDNVTFDDTSVNTAVTIVGNYVAPTLITYGAAQNYSFSGSGIITGPGALLMNSAGGTGVLTISNANTFSGGTTIQSGTVKAQNYRGLGVGPVTLAGGILELPVVGSATVGLSNSINVTATSTLQYDFASTYGGVIYGGIAGNPGTTLNIYLWNANNATGRLRLYGAFTNNAKIALSSLGATVEIAPYNSAGNQVYNGVISGPGHFTLRGNGNVIFNAVNTFGDGTHGVILSGGNLGLGIDAAPTSGAAGVGSLGIDTTAGGCSIFADGGARTLSNPIDYISTNSTTLSLNGSNNLTLAGALQLSQSSDLFATNRMIQVGNTAATMISGAISDGGLGSGITKTGPGALYLNAVNTYTGPTTNAGGLLAGSGSLAGSVFVQTNSAIGGGSSGAIGVLTINSNLTVNGDVFIRVNKSMSPGRSNDLVSVSGTVANIGIGTVTVTNIGAVALVVGDTFKLFNKAVVSGGVLAITGGGMNWTNKLALDGSITALSVASTVATNAVPVSFSVSGNSLNLAWPSDHLGWTLLTNSVDVTKTNFWFPVTGSDLVTNYNTTISPAKTNVFFRLVHPYP